MFGHFRRMLFGYPKASTPDQNPDHQGGSTLTRAQAERENSPCSPTSNGS